MASPLCAELEQCRRTKKHVVGSTRSRVAVLLVAAAAMPKLMPTVTPTLAPLTSPAELHDFEVETGDLAWQPAAGNASAHFSVPQAHQAWGQAAPNSTVPLERQLSNASNGALPQQIAQNTFAGQFDGHSGSNGGQPRNINPMPIPRFPVPRFGHMPGVAPHGHHGFDAFKFHMPKLPKFPKLPDLKQLQLAVEAAKAANAAAAAQAAAVAAAQAAARPWSPSVAVRGGAPQLAHASHVSHSNAHAGAPPPGARGAHFPHFQMPHFDFKQLEQAIEAQVRARKAAEAAAAAAAAAQAARRRRSSPPALRGGAAQSKAHAGPPPGVRGAAHVPHFQVPHFPLNLLFAHGPPQGFHAPSAFKPQPKVPHFPSVPHFPHFPSAPHFPEGAVKGTEQGKLQGKKV